MRVSDADGKEVGRGQAALSELLESGKDWLARPVHLQDTAGRPVATAVLSVTALAALQVAQRAGSAKGRAWEAAGAGAGAGGGGAASADDGPDETSDDSATLAAMGGGADDSGQI